MRRAYLTLAARCHGGGERPRAQRLPRRRQPHAAHRAHCLLQPWRSAANPFSRCTDASPPPPFTTAWSMILLDGNFEPTRSQVDLKDKWRNLQKAAAAS